MFNLPRLLRISASAWTMAVLFRRTQGSPSSASAALTCLSASSDSPTACSANPSCAPAREVGSNLYARSKKVSASRFCPRRRSVTPSPINRSASSCCACAGRPTPTRTTSATMARINMTPAIIPRPPPPARPAPRHPRPPGRGPALPSPGLADSADNLSRTLRGFRTSREASRRGKLGGSARESPRTGRGAEADTPRSLPRCARPWATAGLPSPTGERERVRGAVGPLRGSRPLAHRPPHPACADAADDLNAEPSEGSAPPAKLCAEASSAAPHANPRWERWRIRVSGRRRCRRSRR